MTNADIKALKVGDRVRYFEPFREPREITITQINSRGVGSTPRTAGHSYVIVTYAPFEGYKHDTLVLESDEYITALGLLPFAGSNKRVRGCEAVVLAWGGGMY